MSYQRLAFKNQSDDVGHVGMERDEETRWAAYLLSRLRLNGKDDGRGKRTGKKS